MAQLLPLYAADETVTTVISPCQPAYPTGAVYGTVTLTARSRAKSLPRFLFDRYQDYLTDRPICTKSATVGVVYLFSDVCAQLLSGTRLYDLDVYRTFIMVLIGMFYSAPFYHYSYEKLERMFPTTRRRNSFVQLFFDQVLLSPLWTLSFLVLRPLLQGRFSLASLEEEFSANFFQVLVTSWTVFPILQAMNFTLVPSNMRMLVLTVGSFFFSMFVSLCSSGQDQNGHVAHFFLVPFT